MITTYASGDDLLKNKEFLSYFYKSTEKDT